MCLVIWCHVVLFAKQFLCPFFTPSLYISEDLLYVYTAKYIPLLSFSSYPNLLHTAPSAAPTSVSVSAVTSSSITVQWGAVNCIHHNGHITGYSLQYGVVESGNTQTMNVLGGSITETTLSNLMSSTTYYIEVAAVNIVDIGPYSSTLLHLTAGMLEFIIY